MLSDLWLLARILTWRMRDHHELNRRERHGVDIPRIATRFDVCPHVAGGFSAGTNAMLALADGGEDGLLDLFANEREVCRFCTPRTRTDRLLARLDNGRALRIREERLAQIRSYIRAREDHPAGSDLREEG